MKKNIKVKLKIKSNNPNLPDWGLGPGILAEQEVIFDDSNVSEIQIASMLNEVYNNLVKDNIQPEFEKLN